MEELKDALKGTSLEPGKKDRLMGLSLASEGSLSVDSLDATSGSLLRPEAGHTQRLVGRTASGSWISLADLSTGDDSVFVSTASSCSEEMHATHETKPLANVPTTKEERKKESKPSEVRCESSSPDSTEYFSIQEVESQSDYESDFYSPLPIRSTEEWEEGDPNVLVEFPEEGTTEIVEVEEEPGYYYLSPILESSEPSDSANSDSAEEVNQIAPQRQMSSSCEALPTQAQLADFQQRCQTFPRTRSSSGNDPSLGVRTSSPRTLYPLEPRELDPCSFQQLHTADSTDELQEFLLLETQCMANDEGGLASAFINSDSPNVSGSGKFFLLTKWWRDNVGNRSVLNAC